MRNPQLIAALFVGLLATACGPTPDGGAEALPTGAHQLVLRMDYSPGFARVPENAPLPAFSLYGDGRIISADQDLNAPAAPGGWQRAREMRINSAGIQRLLDAARAAGLADASTTTASSGSSPTALPAPDAPSARFLLLGKDGERHSLTVDVPEAHGGALGELFRALSNPADWLGGSQTTPYRPDALAVLRRDEPSPVPGAQQWPLGSLTFPGTQLGSGQRTMTCTVLRGDPAAALTAQAAGTPQYSQWTDGQHTGTLELRPLLPDENDCRDLRTGGIS